MARFQAKNVGSIEFTDERRRHILERHPDVTRYLPQLPQVLENPETTRRSRHDPTVRLYYRHVTRNKYLTAVVKTNKRNFLLTTYLTDHIAHPEEL